MPRDPQNCDWLISIEWGCCNTGVYARMSNVRFSPLQYRILYLLGDLFQILQKIKINCLWELGWMKRCRWQVLISVWANLKPPTLCQGKHPFTVFLSGKPLTLSPCWAMITIAHDTARHRYPYHIIVQHKVSVQVSNETHFSKQGICLALVRISV